MSRVQRVLAVAREIERWATVKILNRVHTQTPADFDQSDDGKPDIVLLPGVGQRWGYLKSFATALSKLGYRIQIVHELGDNRASIPESARVVRHFVEQHDIRRAIIVAHSKAGLFGKYYLLHFNDDDRVLGVIAIGTPFSGTRATRYFSSDAIAEMSIDSQIIHELGKAAEVNERIVSIFPTFDTHVWHERKSHLDGAKNVELALGGHNSLLWNRRVIQAVVHEIEAMTPEH